MKKFYSAIFILPMILFSSFVVSAASDTYTATKVISNGFDNPNNEEVMVGCYYNGHLYAGTRSNSTNGSSIWKSSDGKTWDIVLQTINGFGDTNNTQVMAMCAWNGHIYASTRNYATGTELWRSADGASWSQVNSNGFGSSDTNKARAIVPYQNQLFVITGNWFAGGQVWASANGTNWSQANVNGFGNVRNTDIVAATVFNGYLYCATEKEYGPDTGIEIWRYDGSSWVLTQAGGFGDMENVFPTTMLVFSHCLYIGTENNITIGELWRSQDGSTWVKVGQISGTTTYAPIFAVGTTEDSHIYAWGSSGRNYSLDTLFTSMDGQNWTRVDECGGFPSFSFNDSIYVSSKNINSGKFNDVYKLIRNNPDQSSSGDINGDGQVGLEEAINALQVISGIRSNP